MEEGTRIENIANEIRQGTFGSPGEKFMNVREFALRYKIRTSTANKIFEELRQSGLITLRKKNHYLSHGVVLSNTPLGRIRTERNMISLLSTHMESYYLPSFADRMEKELRKAGYQMIMQYIDADTYHDVLKTAYDIGVKGFAVLADMSLNKLICENTLLPCVTDGNDMTDRGVDCVLSGGEKQAVILADMMVDAGCTEFIFALSRVEHIETNSVYRTFREQLEKRGFPAEQHVILLEETLLKKRKYCAQKITSGAKKGIICASEMLCNLITGYCMENNITIPQKAVVVAFRTKSAFNREHQNVITVSENVEKEAEAMVKQILRRIAGDTAPAKRIVVEPIAVHKMTENKGEER